MPTDEFRYRLLLVRLHAGNLTTRQAAERCGLSYVSWSNWERGKKPRDKADVADAISAGLGIDRDWLLWGGPLATERRDPLGTRVVARGRKAPMPSYDTPTVRSGCVPERRAGLTGRAVTVRNDMHASRRTGRVSRPMS